MSGGQAAVNRLFDFLFYMLAGMLLAFSLSLAVIAMTIIEIPDGRLLFYCAGFVAAFYLLFWSRKVVFVFFGCISAALIAACVSLIITKFQINWFLQLRDTVEWILALAKDQAPYKESYADSLAMFIAFMLSMITGLNLRVYFNVHLPAIVAVVIFAGPIYTDWGVDTRAIPLFLLAFLLLLGKKLNMYTYLREKGKDGLPSSAYAALLIPLCLTAYGAAAALPKPASELTEDRPKTSIFDAADNFVQGLTPSRTLTFTENGGRLGGPITMTDDLVMRVRANEPVYLAGSVRDEYTGSSWKMSDEQVSELTADEEGWFGTSEYPRDLVATQEYYMRYYGRAKTALTVDIGDVRTRIVYTPPFRSDVRFTEGVTLNANNYGQLRTGRAMPVDTAYTQEYISWDYNNSYFINILQTMAAQSVDAAVVKADMQQYLALPDALPARVRELAISLTEGRSNDYDRLMALSRYLASFPYTLEPEIVPVGADFVDYFLFEGREGYCVYFASALTVLGRCAGVPTRYVEGFILPGERDADGAYTVTNKQAHAWAEAYFPGFGWVRFESTPPYFAGEYSEPLPEPEEHQEETPAEKPETPEEQPEEAPAEEPEAEPSEPLPDDEESEITLNPAEPMGKWLPGLLTGLAMALLSALFVRILVSRFRARSARLRELPNREGSVAYFAGIVRAAEALGYPMRDAETAIDYARRVGETPVFAAQPSSLNQLVDVFCRASYSDGEISDGEHDAMRDCYRSVLRQLRQAPKYRLRYLFGRYVLLRF